MESWKKTCVRLIGCAYIMLAVLLIAQLVRNGSSTMTAIRGSIGAILIAVLGVLNLRLVHSFGNVLVAGLLAFIGVVAIVSGWNEGGRKLAIGGALEVAAVFAFLAWRWVPNGDNIHSSADVPTVD